MIQSFLPGFAPLHPKGTAIYPGGHEIRKDRGFQSIGQKSIVFGEAVIGNFFPNVFELWIFREQALVESGFPVEMTHALGPVIGHESMGDKMIVGDHVFGQVAQIAEDKRVAFISFHFCFHKKTSRNSPAVTVVSLARQVFPHDRVRGETAVDELLGKTLHEFPYGGCYDSGAGEKLQREIDVSDWSPGEGIRGKEEDTENDPFCI